MTPHLDALAAGGTRFENFYVMPQCTPTRLSFLTGQYPFRHGWVNHWDVPRWGGGAHYDWNRNPSIARVLRDAGYRTAVAGKWQLGVEPEVVLAAYRVGDSPMNAITPLNAYFAMIVTFAIKYQKEAGIGTVIALMLPYVIWISVIWTAFLAGWYLLGIPWGL